MCMIYNIKLYMMVLTYVKPALALYIFGVGCHFASSAPIQQGFGLGFANYGVGFIFLGMISGAIAPPLRYAIDKHNRFLLVVCFAMDTLVFGLLLQQGGQVLKHTNIEFPKALQADCLLNTPQIYTPEECAPFLNSDRVAGFRLFWEGYYIDRTNPSSFQVLTTIQGDTCCGFFAPLACKPNKEQFPPEFSVSGITPDYLKQRVICGNVDGYYPSDSNCLVYFNQAVVPPIVGGCDYDLGLGYCLKREITVESSGCASATEDYLIASVRPHGVFISGLSILNFLAMFLAACMWWKRKEFDVFPEYNPDQLLGASLSYHEIKDQFEVVPKPGLLQKEGFLPSDDAKFEKKAENLRAGDQKLQQMEEQKLDTVV